MSEHSGKIVVDLDGVIAGPKTESYDDCLPNLAMIARLQQLKSLGFTIAIHTSRNVRSHDHNMGKLTADTAISVSNYLNRVGCPFDELWMGKPWVGKTGFYVDDRAVSPRQFLQLEMSELLNMARNDSFMNTNKTSTGWLLLRTDDPAMMDSAFFSSVKDAREKGFRTGLLVESGVIPGALDQALVRAGVKVFHEADYSPRVIRTLLSEGLATPTSPIIMIGDSHSTEVSIPAIEAVEGILKNDPGDNCLSIGLGAVAYAQDLSSQTDKAMFNNLRPIPIEFGKWPLVFELKSRHFNQVLAHRDVVYKVSFDPIQRQKLKLELAWLNRVNGSVKATAIPGGYSSPLAEQGALASVLARTEMTDKDVDQLANSLTRLWVEMDDSGEDAATEDDYGSEHQELYIDKSINRLEKLEAKNKRWVVNGEACGSPAEVVRQILAELPVQTAVHRGVMHGDFCPGNIVVKKPWGYDLAVIDPRATVNGTTLALYGDLRYDLAKLSHALRWGYDTIIEEWYDCTWVEDDETVNIGLELYDEISWLERPNRLRLWDKLSSLGIHEGPNLHDDEVQLIAALQLITCAPLHMDDPKRAKALVARGLQAGVQTLERIKAKEWKSS